MAMTLVELKKQLASQVVDLLKVEEFRVNYARFDDGTKNWSVTISYMVELQPDPNGRKFKLERNATLTTDSEGKIMSISAC